MKLQLNFLSTCDTQNSNGTQKPNGIQCIPERYIWYTYVYQIICNLLIVSDYLSGLIPELNHKNVLDS